jgi:hypothetical protein
MSIEKELNAFEEAFRKVSREYDVFLFGSSRKVPVESRKRAEQMLRAMTAQRVDSAAERYRLNTLNGRFSAECERWDRAQRDKEEGRGRFVRAGAEPAPNAGPSASVKPAAAPEPDRTLYERFVQARRGRGEGSPEFEKFREQLAREREKLREKTGKTDWEFDVADSGDRVKLIARPGKGKTE